METVQIIALTMGVAWASGINLYASIATLGLLGASGNLDLPPDLVILQHPAVIVAAGFMYCVEFFADKIPGVDTAWDGLHTFVRIPAAAILAAGAVGEVDPALTLVAGILGGTLAATSHTLKAGTRVLINASPEPFSNSAVSLAEDTLVFAGLLGAVYQPEAFLVFVVLFIVGAVWAIPKIWRGARLLFARIAAFFRPAAQEAPDPRLQLSLKGPARKLP
jgi:hypothetical protein